MKHGLDYQFVGFHTFVLLENKFGRTSDKAINKNRVDLPVIQGSLQWPSTWPLPVNFVKVDDDVNTRNIYWKQLVTHFQSMAFSKDKVSVFVVVFIIPTILNYFLMTILLRLPIKSLYQRTLM